MGTALPAFAGLIALPPLGWTLSAVATVAAAAVLSWLWTGAIRLSWALGFDRPRRLAFTIAPVRLMLLVGVAFSVLAPPWSGLTHMEGIAAALALAALATLWGLRHLRDVAGALTLAFTRSFSVGDQIALGDATGRVVAFGLTRVRIQTPYGERLDLPAGALASGTLRVAMRPGGALPVSVTVPIPPGPGPDLMLEGLRDHALLSPYADASAPVVVELVSLQVARVTATPVHPDDADELRSDLTGRAASLAATYR